MNLCIILLLCTLVMVVLGGSNNLFYCLIFLRGHPRVDGEEEGLEDGVTNAKSSKTKRIQ